MSVPVTSAPVISVTLRNRFLLVLGVLGTLAGSAAAWRIERRAAAATVDAEVTERVESLRAHLQRGRLAIELLAAFHRASDHVGPEEFTLFGQALLRGQFGARWVAWRPAAAGDRAGGDAVNGDDAADLLRVEPASCRDEAVGVLATLPFAPASSASLIDRAAPPLLLLRDAVPMGQRFRSGEVVVALDLIRIAELSRRDHPVGGFHLLFRDQNHPAQAVAVPSRLGGAVDATASVGTTAPAAFAVGGVELDLHAVPSDRRPEGAHVLSLAVLLGGLGLTALFGFSLLRAERTRQRIERVVEERTQQLARAAAQLELRVAERTSELAEANAELESFSYSVSHDLRAPLRAVDGFAGVLLEDHADRLDAEGRRVLGVIRDGCRRMGLLIDALLRLSRLGRQALHLGNVDLDALVATVVGELRASERAGEEAPRAATRFVVGPLGSVRGDPVLLSEVLRNLLGNAVKFSARSPSPCVEVVRRDEADAVVLSVADNGVGFDPADAGRLFAPFQRLHRQEDFVGSGIGLALSQRIVRRHGGAIEADGKPGRGAVFTVRLPRSTNGTP
jgi:signal transduction histidine kinase